jgi:hypothetical protein
VASGRVPAAMTGVYSGENRFFEPQKIFKKLCTFFRDFVLEPVESHRMDSKFDEKYNRAV